MNMQKKYLYLIIALVILGGAIFAGVALFGKNKAKAPVPNPAVSNNQTNLPSFSGSVPPGNSNGSANSVPAPAASNTSGTPQTSYNGQEKHVLIVMGENQNFDKIIGNTQDMPYLNSLANTYAYAKEYYGNVHPSMGNYFMLTGGKIFSDKDSFSDEVKDDNIVRHLIAAGKTWKEYSENLPSVGYTGTDTNGYTQHHNPLSYYSDVRENSAQAKNLVPFSQFATDLANHNLPNYSFIVPNNGDNAHSCSNVSCFDNWLKTNIDPLIKNSDFNTPGNGLLIITFDESASSDKTRGGGHTVWVAVGPDVKKGYSSSTVYQQENTLRFTSELLGLTNFPGQAASATSMKEFMMGN